MFKVQECHVCHLTEKDSAVPTSFEALTASMDKLNISVTQFKFMYDERKQQKNVLNNDLMAAREKNQERHKKMQDSFKRHNELKEVDIHHP